MALIGVTGVTGVSELRLPLALGSGMVLQRAPKAARLWGWAAAGEQVTAMLDGGPHTAGVADSSGQWNLMLPPQPASLVGRTITITAPTSGGIRNLTDVLFGDVFLCSGQSHMSFSVNQDLNGSAEIAASAQYVGLRMLTVADDCRTAPSADLKDVKFRGRSGSAWAVSEPESFGSANFGYPSAICYFFGRHLYTQLGGSVPVGVLSAAVGGSAIEFWMSAPARADASCGGVAAEVKSACPPAVGEEPSSLTQSEEAVATAGWDHGGAVAGGGWSFGCFYNAMVSPLAPMALRGILWDQGEANYKDSCAAWGCKLAALAHDWRHNLFGQDDLLFTFDQLRADTQAAGIGAARLASAMGAATYASRVDLQTCLANDTSEGHATRKVEVGRRLSLAAMVRAYAQPPTNLSYGPTIAGASVALLPGRAARPGRRVASLLNVSIRLAFASGLHHYDAPECAGCCRGATGPLIRGTPKTGDGWSFVMSDGTRAAVCQDPGLGCDGAANIVGDGRDGASVWMLLDAAGEGMAKGAAANRSLATVVYGGTGPWLSTRAALEVPSALEAPSALQCVYPHEPRFGIEACALYNGIGGYDDHQGVAMPAQWFPVP